MSFDFRPIGVFDSGLGGLSVLKSLKLVFPHEDFIYLGDTARLPYGTKSAETIRNYGLQIIHYLLKRGVKAIVVACNSASTQCQDSEIGVTPLYNVIGPGAMMAVSKTRNFKIGVLGTRATVISEAYPQAIAALNSQILVKSQACPLLVSLAEEGWVDDPITNLIVYRYVNELLQWGLDTLVLGCTHFPILRESITKVTGPNIELVDSGEALAYQLKADFKKGRLTSSDPDHHGEITLLTTDYSPYILERALAVASPYTFVTVEKVHLGA